MSTTLSSRRKFGTWMVSLFAGAGVASVPGGVDFCVERRFVC
jgi:hypothetical protein